MKVSIKKRCIKSLLLKPALLVSVVIYLASTGDSLAQTSESTSTPSTGVTRSASAPTPSNNAMVNLVRLLVAQGTISKEKGDALIAEALREASQASATPADQAAEANNTPLPAGTIRVPYVPEVVRNQIRDELKADVLKEAKEQGWASPGNAAPEWTRAIRLYGDLRLRSQSVFYNASNSNLMPNFQAIVASEPINVLNGAIPFLDTTKNHYNFVKLRARLGADIAVNAKVKVGIEFSSGDNAYPVSTNVNLGGGFFKRGLYLYKAFVEADPTAWWRLTAGRMDNPFLSTDALFAPDLKFDGFASELSTPKRLFGAAFVKARFGAFPLDFGDQNFPDTSIAKTRVSQKWLISEQIEADYRLSHGIDLKIAAAYHDFLNFRGIQSTPCELGITVTQCSTDGKTPFYVQQGNTLFQMRNIVNASGQSVGGNQVLGLTQPFRVLDVMEAVTIPVSVHTNFSIVGDYLRNLAFRRHYACRYGLLGEPLNNGGSGGNGNICDSDLAKRTPYVAGNQGFQVIASLGYPTPRQWPEWKIYGGYKYLQSDSVLDAFNDPDFHLGGTNAKGYIIGGTLGLYKNMSTGFRWLSTNQITGAPLAIDVLQLDLNVVF